MRPIDTDALIAEIVRIDDLRKLSTATIGKAIHAVPTLDVAPVVFCKDCEYCHPLFCGPDGAAAGDGSFSCGENEMDYYAPSYHMNTYYCADGKRRGKPCT